MNTRDTIDSLRRDLDAAEQDDLSKAIDYLMERDKCLTTLLAQLAAANKQLEDIASLFDDMATPDEQQDTPYFRAFLADQCRRESDRVMDALDEQLAAARAWAAMWKRAAKLYYREFQVFAPIADLVAIEEGE